jgi:hypothetical protein
MHDKSGPNVSTDMNSDRPPQVKSPRLSRWRKYLLLGCVGILVLAVALGVGLGVGLTRNHNSYVQYSNETAGTPPVVPTANTTASQLWQPKVGATWDYPISGSYDSTDPRGIDVIGIDLFDNNETVFYGLQANGAKVICYFSAGTSEDWRPDYKDFAPAVLGENLDAWPGERYVDIRSEVVRNIMSKRLDLAADKGCGGVDPDNVDGYSENNGFNLTQEDAVDYINFLASSAQARNLSIGLKNVPELVPWVINLMQWAIVEECIKDKFCYGFVPFIRQRKPVFNVEYPKKDRSNDKDVPQKVFDQVCDNVNTRGFSTIIKNLELDTWIGSCPYIPL